MSEELIRPTPPYPAYWYSGGRGEVYSVYEDGVLLSKHRTLEAARARVTQLEEAFLAALTTTQAKGGEG